MTESDNNIHAVITVEVFYKTYSPYSQIWHIETVTRQPLAQFASKCWCLFIDNKFNVLICNMGICYLTIIELTMWLSVCVWQSTSRTADVPVSKIAGYVRVRILMNRLFFRIFGIHSFYATATMLNI